MVTSLRADLIGRTGITSGSLFVAASLPAGLSWKAMLVFALEVVEILRITYSSLLGSSNVLVRSNEINSGVGVSGRTGVGRNVIFVLRHREESLACFFIEKRKVQCSVV